MSIILRMNDLPLSANSLDIRRFFRGIRIPDGGVHIIGGPESSVFIAFNDDSAAAEAMKMNGKTILEYPVRIGLSSRNEMKNLIKTLFECAIMEESCSSADPSCSLDKQASPNLGSSSPSSGRYPSHVSQVPLLTMHSSQAGHAHQHPPFEIFDSQFDDTNFGPPPQAFDWNEAGPSCSTQYRGAPLPKHNMQPSQTSGINGHLPPPLSSNDLDDSRSLAVEVVGLPFGVSIQDVMEFFYPLCTEENIQFIEDERNYPTGVALIHFRNLSDFNQALDRNGEHMGDKRIWVRPLQESQSNRPNFMPFQPPLHPGPPGPPLMGRGPPPPMGPYYGPPDCGYDPAFGPGGFNGPVIPMGPPIPKPVVYMKGLPFERCTIHDIEEFFLGLRIVNIEMENDKRGRLAGNAYVEFASMEDFEKACTSYHMRHMGSRYIEVLPVNTERVRSYCIHLKKIPDCSINDIGNFLKSFNFVPGRIHRNIKYKEAYVEFFSVKEQLKAVDTLDGKFWEGQAVSVTKIPFQVMMKKMNDMKSLSPDDLRQPSNYRSSFRERSPPGSKRKRQRIRPNPTNSRRKPGYSGGYDPFEDKKCVLIALDCDLRTQIEDVCEFFKEYGIQPDMIDIRDSDNGTANVHVAFHNHFDAKNALENMNREKFLGKSIHLRPA